MSNIQLIEWDSLGRELRELIRNRKQRVNKNFNTYYDAFWQLTDRLEVPIPDNELVGILKRNLRPEVRKELIHFEITSTPRSRAFAQELKRYRFPKFNGRDVSRIEENEIGEDTVHEIGIFCKMVAVSTTA